MTIGQAKVMLPPFGGGTSIVVDLLFGRRNISFVNT